MKKVFLALFLSLSLIGCTLFRIPEQAVKTVGIAIETTGKIAEAAGKAVMAGGHAVGKIADTGGKAIEVIDKTPGAKEAIISQIK